MKADICRWSVFKWLRSIVCVSLIFNFQFSIFNSVQGQTAVGKWRSCLDYSAVYHVAVASDRVYAAGQGGLFVYDLDDLTVIPLTKGSGLNDAGVATMAYDPVSRCLVVAYNNSNVDIRYDGHTYNLSDIKRSEIPGDRSVNHVRFYNGRAYLCAGFGVVVVNLQRYEIEETWYLGDGGGYTPVYDLAVAGDSIYASTGEGLKRIALADRHPSVADRWETDTRIAGQATILEPFGGKLLVAVPTVLPEILDLYCLEEGLCQKWNQGEVHSMRVGGGLVTVAREECVVRYNSSLAPYDSLSTYTWGTLSAYDAVSTEDGSLWVGHEWDGLIRIRPDGSDDTHRPDGPYSQDHCYRLRPFNHRMMLCPGGHTSTYANTYLPPNLLTAEGRSWRALDMGDAGLLSGKYDITDAAVNPRDTHEVVAALWGSGVVSVRDNKVSAFYDASNTDGALVPYSSGGYTTLNTGALDFDRQGNLWVLVSHSTHALAVRRTNGTWQSFATMGMVSNPEVDKLVCDSINGYKWFLGRSNVIYVHDGQSRMARVNPNHGSKLNTESVTALVQDQNGNLWLGTNKGIKVIYDGYRAFVNGGNGEESPVSCSNITITNGEFAEYLMAYESITAIAVDGANRKWVGTANGGLYLISANGLEQLEHFTASNSPLFSDKVVTIGINERTGEVYVGTDRGLQVYRGTATYADSKPHSDIHAFPNPVRPGYDGPIAIKGFTRNGIVHITNAAGHTVYSTTANGGQAIWNGRNHDGEPVASGVYYVFASDEQGNNRSVAKILIIR